MKGHLIIDDRLKDWHVVDAPQMADETFNSLDADEVIRLAQRAWTEEWRAALRSKGPDGLPKYASIEQPQPDGSVARVYKQTALFEIRDYETAIRYHRAEAISHLDTAARLARRCNAVHGTDIPIPGMELTA